MGIINDKKHYAYAKKKYTQLKNGSVQEAALVVLRLKGSKDVIVHFDKIGQLGKYKNPTVAQRIFQKTGAFETNGDEDFYDDLSKIVMLAGTASFSSGGLVFDKKKGRGTEGDFKVAMKLFKVRKASFGSSAKEDSTDNDVLGELGVQTATTVERILKKCGGKLPSQTQLITDPGHFFKSIDELGDLIQSLQGSKDEQQLRLLDRLLEANAYITQWSDSGIAPVSDAMSVLSDVTEEEARKEQEEIDQINQQELQEELDEVRRKTESLLMQKTFSNQFSALFSSGKKLVSLSSGYFTLCASTDREIGGKPVMLISATNSFEHKDLFDQVKRGDTASGRFRRSKSGKKVALIPDHSKTNAFFMRIFKKMGLGVEPIVVESFTNLQAELQRLKPSVLRARRIAEVFESQAFKSYKLPAVFQDDDMLEVFTQFSIGDFSVENVGFYLIVNGRQAPPSLDTAMQVSGKQAIYNTYVAVGSDFEVNIPFTDREALRLLAEDNRYGEMDFSKALKAVRVNLDDIFKRFNRSEKAVGLIVDNPTLRRHFTDI